MTPVSPVLSAEFVSREIIHAKDQPQYRPLPSIRSSGGVVLTRWELTEDERDAIAAGADLYLSCWTFNQPLQPVKLEIVSCDKDLLDLTERMGLPTNKEKNR